MFPLPSAFLQASLLHRLSFRLVQSFHLFLSLITRNRMREVNCRAAAGEGTDAQSSPFSSSLLTLVGTNTYLANARDGAWVRIANFDFVTPRPMHHKQLIAVNVK